MNKPQYLAELSRLLIFMTQADRDETLARYGALFDAAGPDGQDALLEKLSSTTRQAIRLSRVYSADGYEDEELDALEGEVTEKAPAAPAPAPKPAPLDEDLPAYDMADLPDLQDDGEGPAEPDAIDAVFAAHPDTPPALQPTPAPEEPGDGDDADYEELWGKRPTTPQGKSAAPAEPAPAAKEPAPKAAPETSPDGDLADLDGELDDGDDGEEYDDEPAPQPVPEPRPASVQTVTVKRVMPLWIGIPLFILAIPVLVLPLTLVGLLLIPTLILPGLAVLFSAFLAFVGGLWCLSIIADAAVLFGLACILLAAGLSALWLGLWLDVALVNLWSRGVKGLSHLTLGRKVIRYA